VDELKIEKNIPLPKKHHARKKSKFYYLLKKMEVGDSILFKDKKEGQNFVKYADGKGVRVAQRQLSQNGEIRAWKTDPDGTINSVIKAESEKFVSEWGERIYKDRKEKKYG